jgi:hypothetical protein
MERIPMQGVNVISSGEYTQHFASAKHLFLAGDLGLPNPHPFFRDARLEIIACKYEPGDDGLFHWHASVTEYEFVLEGSISYVEADTGILHSLEAGDLTLIPPGVCVRRQVDQSSRLLAIKVPSSAGKIHCPQCKRTCASRQQPFEGNA